MRIPILHGRAPDLTATIQFLTADEVGRVSSVMTGHFPSHVFGDEHGLVGAFHRYERDGWIAAGETAKAESWLIAPEVHKVFLSEGPSLKAQEASHVVGHGRIETILDANLMSPPSQ